MWRNRNTAEGHDPKAINKSQMSLQTFCGLYVGVTDMASMDNISSDTLHHDMPLQVNMLSLPARYCSIVHSYLETIILET